MAATNHAMHDIDARPPYASSADDAHGMERADTRCGKQGHGQPPACKRREVLQGALPELVMAHFYLASVLI